MGQSSSRLESPQSSRSRTWFWILVRVGRPDLKMVFPNGTIFDFSKEKLSGLSRAMWIQWSKKTAAGECFVIDTDKPLGLPDSSVDVLISERILGHIEDASFWVSEFDRVVTKGGEGRTPNKNAYISVATRLVPNKLHVKVLRHAPPNQAIRDIFANAVSTQHNGDDSKTL
jgi:hypothetical protein